jgi:hypothetical protein
MGMVEMQGDKIERQQDQVRAAHLERTAKLQVAQDAAGDAQENAQDIGNHHAVHRMPAKIGERGKDFRIRGQSGLPAE